MPQTAKWLKAFGRYAPDSKWQNLEPPRKDGENRVSLPSSWNDEAKTFTDDIVGRYGLKKEIKWNVGTEYTDKPHLEHIVKLAQKEGLKLPVFYQQEVLPTMHQNIQNNADDSGAASSSNIDAISCNTLPPEKEIQELKITNEAQNKEIEELKQQIAQLYTQSDAIQKPAQASPSLLESVATLSEDEWDVLPSGEAPD